VVQRDGEGGDGVLAALVAGRGRVGIPAGDRDGHRNRVVVGDLDKRDVAEVAVASWVYARPPTVVRKPDGPAAAPMMESSSTASFKSSSCKSTVTVRASSAPGVPDKSKVKSRPVASVATPAGAMMSNSASCSPVKLSGTITGAVRTPPPKVTVKLAAAASPADAAPARAKVT